jgi:hypothetical protein
VIVVGSAIPDESLSLNSLSESLSSVMGIVAGRKSSADDSSASSMGGADIDLDGLGGFFT